MCRLSPDAAIPAWSGSIPFVSITRTSEELSVVCHASHVPNGVRSEKGWICLKLEGPFPFSLTGVLASFLDPLRDSASIFAISTFDTDYVLIKEECAEAGMDLLRRAGHKLI